MTWLELLSHVLDIRAFTFEFMLTLDAFPDDEMLCVFEVNFDRLTGSLSNLEPGAVIFFRRSEPFDQVLKKFILVKVNTIRGLC